MSHPRGRRGRTLGALALAASALAAISFSPAGATAAASSGPRALLVGTWHGIKGQYRSIQAAVDAAHPGDWILVGPGDYKARGYLLRRWRGGGASHAPAGVLITTPDIWLRGMNRNKVIVDGTRPGSPVCSRRRQDQVVTKTGLNGIEVYKADGTWIQNLTVCNYLTNRAGSQGNEIWWNGGQGTGKVGMGSYYGSYLTATSTYSRGVNAPYALYGIYADNARGPARINHTYASNMGDSAYYIGACRNCNVVLSHAHAEYSALGYSGTNSGGHLVIEDSRFDHNKSGITSNSQNNGDAPSPQSGACPHGRRGPLHNGICFVIEHNVITDNDNPNVPGNAVDGLAGASPVGAGIVLAGTRFSEIYDNVITHNDSWGVLVADLPDQESPPSGIGQHCNGGTYIAPPGVPSEPPVCYYQALANRVIANHFAHNGSYGNPTNGDVALFTTASVELAAPHHVEPSDCFARNRDPAGFTSDPAMVQSDPLYACGDPTPGNPDPVAAFEAECAAQLLASCPGAKGIYYPRASHVRLHMPPPQATMPNPCAGAPVNPWCPAGSGAVSPGGDVASAPAAAAADVVPSQRLASGWTACSRTHIVGLPQDGGAPLVS